MTSPCPVCQAPITTPNLAQCDECQVSLDWRSGQPAAHHPFIKPGEPLYYTDLTRTLLPGQERPDGTLSDGTKFETTPRGALVSVMPKRAFECFERRLRIRDACVRASFVALDEGVTLGCMGRIDTIQGAKLRYMLLVDAANRYFRIERGFSSTDVAQSAALLPWTHAPSIGRVGELNVIELRLQGPTLEARINDQHAATIHDAVLGIGGAGLRVGSKPECTAPVRATVQWFEIRQVAA